MAFDWNLDTRAAEDSTPDYLGFEPLGLSQEPVAPVVPPTFTSASTPSRRELRMAALRKPKKGAAAPEVPAAPSPWAFAAPQTPAQEQFAPPQQQVAPPHVQFAPPRQQAPITSPEQSRRGASSSHLVKAKKPLSRRVLPKVLSLGAMLGAGALLVATSVPANAFMSTSADAATTVAVSHAAVQKLAVVKAVTTAAVAPRDKYTVVSLADQMRLKFMSTDFSYTNDPNGTIQWPFPVRVPISSGFGPRHVAGCSFCSTFHEGIDFDPGQGVAIGAIADGVVSQVVESHAGLGNHVVVDHVVNGQKVQSVYGHMLDGSIRVVVGQHVTVTQEIGQVGSTGESTGAHLHLEIHVNDVPIDPFAWLKANAN